VNVKRAYHLRVCFPKASYRLWQQVFGPSEGSQIMDLCSLLPAFEIRKPFWARDAKGFLVVCSRNVELLSF